MSNPSARKSCVVPKCTSTTTKTPEKLFFLVPMDLKIRKKWLNAMKRLDPFGNKSKVYCCEDHFDIENDMDNYIKYKLVGGKLKLKKGMVPHKFKCQQENKDELKKSAGKLRKIYIENLLIIDEITLDITEKSEDILLACCPDKPGLSFANNDQLSETPKQINRAVQVNLKDEGVHKSTMTDGKYMNQQDVEESVTQHKLSTELLHIKFEPETHDKDTPHIHNTQHMDMNTLCTDEYWKFQTLNDELIIKDEPIGQHEDTVEIECCIKHEPIGHNEDILEHEFLKDEADLYDQLKDEEQVKGDVVSEEYNNDCLRQDKDKSHNVAETSNTSHFTTKNNFERHIPKHNDHSPYECNSCDKAFTRKDLLYLHIRTHTGEKPHICGTCDKAFATKNKLEIHTRSHTGERPYKCNICDKAFVDNHHLKVHTRTHTGDKLYKCDICEKAFAYISCLKIHSHTHTGEKPYKCDTCDKSFAKISRLKIHIRTHTREKPYQCDICEKAFADNKHLKNHIRIHTGERPYKCRICVKAFKQPSAFSYHMLTHTGERPYKCSICDKTFKQQIALNYHIRTHSAAEKPFKCDTCDKAFANSSYLKIHSRIHTGESPHKCNTCNKTFKFSSALNYHMRTHTREKTYKCALCNESFVNLPTLKSHNLTHTKKP